MATPTSHPNGISTAESGTFQKFVYPDPSDAYVYFNDFFTYVSGNWTVTETDAGATQAMTDGAGGQLLITNTAADDDAVSMQLVGESFKLVANKKMWFEVRFKTSDATQSDILFGLVITDTTPLSHTDGVVFRKDDGDANIDFASVKNSSGSTSDAVTTIASNTFVKLGIYFDGTNFHLFKDGVKIDIIPSATICDDEELTLTMQLKNGEAVAKTMTVDYIMAAIER